MRLSTIFSLLLVAVTGFATFAVKYEVEGLLGRLGRLKTELAADRNQIRVLRAEWNYLNRPDTLAALNQRFFSLRPVTAGQLAATIADVPLRAAGRAIAAAPAAGAVPVPVAAVPTSPPEEAAQTPLKTAAETRHAARGDPIGELIASLAAGH